MELEALFRLIRWLIKFYSRLIKAKIFKMILLIPFSTVLLAVLLWMISKWDDYSGSDVTWNRIRCVEKADRILYASTDHIQIETTLKEIYMVTAMRYYQECNIISSPEVDQSEQQNCEQVDLFKVTDPPGIVAERALVDQCTDRKTHKEYVILEDGSVWYWEHTSKPLTLDLYTILAILFFGFLGWLLGSLILIILFINHSEWGIKSEEFL